MAVTSHGRSMYHIFLQALLSVFQISDKYFALKSRKTKINSASVANSYTQEVYDIEMLTGTVDKILDYYNDYLIFAKDNKNLKNNYKAIKEGLNDAKESQRKLVKIIEKTNKLSDESTTYLQNAMVDFRKEYRNWLKHQIRAIGGLENAYTGSLGKVTFNNDASKLILNTVNDYLSSILTNFNNLVKTDIKGANINTYKSNYARYGLTAKINLFDQFVNKNVNSATSTHDIEDYYFNSSIQEKYTTLNEFFKVYSEKNTRSIIDSIQTSEASYTITKTYEDVTDEKGTFNAICKFIKGEN